MKIPGGGPVSKAHDESRMLAVVPGTILTPVENQASTGSVRDWWVSPQPRMAWVRGHARGVKPLDREIKKKKRGQDRKRNIKLVEREDEIERTAQRRKKTE